MNGDYHDTDIHESYKTGSTDANWYKSAFQKYVETGKKFNIMRFLCS
jgi:hypothetical protein